MDFDDSSTDNSEVEPSKEEKDIDELPSDSKADDEPVTNGDHVMEDAHEEEKDLPDSSTDKEAPGLAEKDKLDTPVELEEQEEPEKKESHSSDEVTTSEKASLSTQADSSEKDDKMETESSDVTTTESENDKSLKTNRREKKDKLETLKTENADDAEDKPSSGTDDDSKDVIKTPKAKLNDKDSEKKSKKRKAEDKDEKSPTPKKRGPRKSTLSVSEDGSIPVPPGWRREVVQRVQGASAGKYDVYYYSPLGKKLRSKVDVRNHCEKNNLSIDIEDFLFSNPKGTSGAVTPKPKTPKSTGPKSKKKTKIQGKATPKEKAGEVKVVKKTVQAKVLKKSVNNAQKKKKADDVKKRENSYKMVGSTKSRKSVEVFKEKIYLKFPFKSRKSGRALSSQSQS